MLARIGSRGIWAMGVSGAVLLAAACGRLVVGEPIGEGSQQASPGSPGGGDGVGGDEGPPGPPPDPMMTPEEAEAWCQNYVAVIYPLAAENPPPTPKPEVDGVIRCYGEVACHGPPWPGGSCLIQPTVEDCVRNMLHSSCKATVEELNACVEAMAAAHLGGDCPPPGACDAFAAAEDCENTVVHQFDGEGGCGACGLEVE